MGRARKFIKDIVHHTRGMVRNRGMEKPDWLDYVDRFPPPPMPPPVDKLKKIEFPQDRLAELYVRKSGHLTDDETAYEFADEQLTLIELGVPEKKAYEMLLEKYQKVEDERFLQKFWQMRGKSHIPSTRVDEMVKRWSEEEAEAVKDAMRMEYADERDLAEFATGKRKY
jgi:hypothetical protein